MSAIIPVSKQITSSQYSGIAVSASPMLTAGANTAIDGNTTVPTGAGRLQFLGAYVALTADPAAALMLQIYVRLADDSGDDFLLFQTPVTKGGPAPIIIPAIQAPTGRKLRVHLDADSGGAAPYLLPYISQV